LRSYILDLQPHQMHEENLLQGIQRLANEFRLNTLIDVNLQGTMETVRDLPDIHARALFHICQEALANVAKHAHANQVDVSLWTTSDRTLLEVRDDGRGFDPSKIKRSIGHGLSNMRVRARNIGGDVEITSEPWQGTTTLAWLPKPKENDTSLLIDLSDEPIL
ncbi:MAG: ATP-binding protein, partial [Anaerolineaceae bacterium]|nr:ATP-binding protein [Anaerolineaceae bacterium]